MLTLEEIAEKANEKGICPAELGMAVFYHHDILMAYLEGGVVEQYFMDEWHVDNSPTFGINRKYRIKPLEFQYWEIMLPEYKWVAMDRDGVWKAFTSKPQQYSDSWIGNTRYTSLSCLVMPKVRDWKQSLIERPEGEEYQPISYERGAH